MATHDLSQQTINNRFLLLQKIGVGGMATVYQAIDHELNKLVAVKVLNPEWRSDEVQVGRFRQEARTAARVRHPHLVSVTDRGVTCDGIPFLVMELLEGKSLQEEMASICGPMPWQRVVGIAVQVCAALAAAHQNGLIHRDIKPGNCFLVQGSGQAGDFVKVLDLGIAKVIAGPRDPHAPPSTQAHQGSPGTPEFMAPEQMLGGPTDARSDLYSLGVMMVRMLTGRLPFVAPPREPPWKVLDMHLSEPPPNVRSMAPEADIPESIAEIVLRCMAKQVDDRWSSATELAAALAAAEREERSKAAAVLSGVKTIVYEPSDRTAPFALYRLLMGLQAAVLFALCSMSLMLVELPGVATLAEWFKPSPPPVQEPRQPLIEPSEPPAPSPELEPGPPARSEPEPPPVVPAEHDAELPVAGAATVPSPPAALAEAAPVLVPTDVPPPPVPKQQVAPEPPPQAPAAARSEPVKPIPAAKPRPPAKRPVKVADPFSTSKPAKELVPQVEVQKHMDGLGGKLDRCRDHVTGTKQRIEVEVVLAPGTGKISAARVLKGVNPKADDCVVKLLVTRSVGAVKNGGTFRVTVKL